MITNWFNPQTGILTTDFSGTILVDEIVEWLNNITPHRYPLKKLNLLLNETNAEYSYQPDEYHKIDKANEVVASLFEQFYIAIVHHKPKEMAISEIIHRRKHPKNYYTGVFDSEKNALKWLLKV